ncbi:MAG: peptidoglycan DD-metalloendopeptidase family protein [Gemmatimonadota bacterium]|nr:peptidoglycan DD-metalloendopeptidase family protein [Gemmatimonadota bacterium]
MTRALSITVSVGVVMLGCGGSGPGPTEPPDNEAPSFASAPTTTGDHNRPWSYTVAVSDPDGDPVTVEAIALPAWLTFDATTLTLSGLAGFDNLGNHTVTLRASDGTRERRQHFILTVAPGEISCDQDFGDPLQSPYILPWRAGAEYLLQQGNCNGSGGHVNWFAYDFDLATGDTIIASRAGTVVAVREQFADGTRICGQEQENLVFVQHDDGTIMSYIHLTTNGALVDVNDVLAQGDVIGLSGDSGCSAGPHLHVALFAAQRTGFDRQWSLPINYSNASGMIDGQRQLVRSERYRALP